MVAEHARRRRRSSGRACSSTRSRCRSCSPGGSGARRRRLARTCSAAADFIVAKGPKTQQERWENQERLVAEHDRHRDRRADLRGRRRAGERRPGARRVVRGEGRRLAGEGRVAGPRRAPARTRRSRTTCGSRRTPSPDDRHDLRARRQPPATGRPARDRRQLVPRARAVRRQARGTTRPCSTRSRSATRSSAYDTPSGRIWHRFTFDGYGETARRRRLGHLPDSRAARRSAALWPLLTGERGEYELLAGRDAGPHLRDDREHRERRADAARAGLGRPAAGAASRPARARARRRRWPGRTRSSSGSRGRSRRASRSSGRRSSPAATPARPAERHGRRRQVLR